MTDFFAAAQRVISMIMTGSEITIVTWLVSGGIIYVLRGISFWLDTLIVDFIGSIYKYFMDLLNGTMFNETITDALLRNVYVFIGVFVFFRLAMLLIKYLMNPELVSDEKSGVNSLIKRVIIGMVGILLTPLIFDKATELQHAVIKDQLIQQLILPDDMIAATAKQVEDAGKHVGTYVFAGFLNPSAKASDEIKKEYQIALNKGDFASLDFNSGGFLGLGYQSYDYSYFYFLSTFVLAYVLYLMLKYCLDIVVRFFKMLLYQLMAPIALVEYMINGSQDGVFKNWKNAVLSTYFMLFVRVLSIWFVVFVMTLMSGEYAAYSGNSLLATDDYLLRALIIIGLLGFMMDLPKLIGNIFGLDLEQESSATGVMKSIGGIVKGVGMGALSAGGAALGGAIGAAGSFQKAGLSSLTNRNNAIKSQMNKHPGMTRQAAKASLGMGTDGRKGFKNAVSAAASGKIAGLKSQIKSNNPNLSNAQVEQQAQKMAKQQAKQEVLATDLGKARSISNDSLKSTASAIKSAAVGTLSGMAGAAIASTSIGKAVQSGYSNVSQHMSSDRQKEKQQEQQNMTNAMQQSMQANMADISKSMNESISNQKFSAIVELAGKIASVDSSIVNSSQLATAVMNAQINANHDVGQMSGTMKASMETVQGANHEISTTKDAQMIVTSQLREQGMSESTIQQINQDIEVAYSGSNNGGTPQRIHATDSDAQKWVTKALEYEYKPQAEKAAKMVPLSNGNSQNP